MVPSWLIPAQPHEGRCGRDRDRKGLRGTVVLEASRPSADAQTGLVARPPRKNVMLAATISAGSASAPVRIRNLSELGAMVDGPGVPGAGTSLQLSRLALSVPATVIWSRDGRCGLSLGSPIVVDDWIAGAASVAGNLGAGQQRVDQLQSAIRTGAALPAEAVPAATDTAEAEPLELRIAAELARVKRMLDAVSEELTDDVEVLMRHERAMQNFDIAAMIVEELRAVIAADDPHRAVGSVQMHDLRSRLSGRLTLT
jgi:hypothetical protein